MKYLHSESGRSSIQGVYVAFAANSDLCLSFLKHCSDYGDKVLALSLPSIASLTSPRMDAPYKLRERTMRLRSVMTGVSAENTLTSSVRGLSAYQSTSFDGYH